MGTLSRVFTALNSSNTANNPQHIPMLNVISNSLSGYLNSTGQTHKKKNLIAWYKQIGELTALTNKVAKDVIYKYKFVPVFPSQTGRNKLMAANKFAAQIELRSTMRSQMVDSLVTGESFGWLGLIDDSVIKKEITKSLRKRNMFSTKEKSNIISSIVKEFKVTDRLSDATFMDEQILKPRKYRYMASSTVEIVHDQYDTIEYVQRVGTQFESFSPKQVIHFKQQEFDGRVSGFTPVESIIVQLELLRQMWQNMLAMQRNGGAPDKIITLENEKVGSPSFRRIEQQLQKYKLVENSHGNMLFTGKVNVTDLQQLDKMQFMDMGLYITGLVAMQWNIPRSSIPYIVGGTNTKDDTGGNSERDYWRTIEFLQTDFADTMNTQLWIPYFGVKIVFESPFIVQDLQAESARQAKYNNILTIDKILFKSKKQLSEEKILHMLDLDSEDLTELQEQEVEEGGSAEGMDNQPSKNDLESDDGKRNDANRKREEQAQANRSSGKPVGKEQFDKRFW